MDTSQSTRASEVAPQRAGRREAWIFALLLLLPPLLYGSSYLVIRGNHSLLMTGGAITAQTSESKWLEVAFAPLIWTETLLEVVFGRGPGRRRSRW